MKNLSKRNKTILAIAGIVVVVIVGGGYLLVMNGLADLPLFGLASNAYLDPPNLCVNPGSTRTLTLHNYGLGTTWSISNNAIATLASTTRTTASVKGVAAAGLVDVNETSVKVKGLVQNLDTATIQVYHVCPQVTDIAPNTSIKLVTDLTGGAWESGDTAIAVVGSDGTVYGKSLGRTSIYYRFPGASSPAGNTTLTVTNTPHYYGVGW